MRDLTNIELDAVSGGDLTGTPVWLNSVTKYLQSFPINFPVNAQQGGNGAGFGQFSFQPIVNAINNNV